ncbi:cobalt transport protein [Gordonia bronchialis DSM 43247]|uniref:Cobalt transport protein n=1 Tax=Gordonia bronchialis (strain ATCC 25592 / DSM 43247 / BCRC 13721 / JCM 3198 / KCTC 3076 / NBRC 16047 / NCTC 10667) TaxID=526226 RepID=D0LB75_GORB4|nr:energy-coupling factor transporter transmembrane protein EcfT [Gordonia bronchialis]ACY19506.1 cobalt transport protein [Gordonia bronchialis DSM 43247]MCC3322286.1 energy-coupling factor transporter transmembrane protein EcfT [Gordonia bronchialis]QGS26565.1 energy-coupling factor transporter transmembrane protein EcfT [Gordonia bronchialis]STQ62264.1 Energy-coupling factor transporter transmembrane protein EcfT [Gordonia bronchialis]
MTMRMVPLRQVPGDSFVHRLWAGTKLLIVLILGVMTWVLPSWPALGMVAAVVVITALIAGIPLGALPRPPWWFWGLIALGVAVNASFGLAAVVVFLRAVVLGLVLVASSILVIWTTPMAEVAPALAKLMRPLRMLRLPVDEWAVAIALCLRGLPMLIDELRMLRAAHRLRPTAKGRSDHPSAEMGIMDMITAAMSSALRRSAEMAEAITARGGTGRLTAYPSGPGRADAVALVVIGLACAVAITLTVVL